MAVINNEIYISSKWTGKSNGEIVKYNKMELEIGKDAFANLEAAVSTGKEDTLYILTDDKISVRLPGGVKNLSTQSFADLSQSYSSPDYDGDWIISDDRDGMGELTILDNETTGYTSKSTLEISGGEKSDLTGILNLTITGGEYGSLLGGKYTAKTVADKVVSTKTKLTTTNSFNISRTAQGKLKMSGNTSQYSVSGKASSYTGYASVEILENVSFANLKGGNSTDTRTLTESLVYKTNTVTITDKSKKTDTSTGKAVFVNPQGGNVQNYASVTAQMDPYVQDGGTKKPGITGLAGGNQSQTWETTEKLIREDGEEDKQLSWQENITAKNTATGTVRLIGSAVNAGEISGYSTVDLSGEKNLKGKEVPDSQEGVAGQVTAILSNAHTGTMKINRTGTEDDDNWTRNDTSSITNNAAGKVEISGKLGVPSVSATGREYGFKVGQDEDEVSIGGYKTVEVENAEIQSVIRGGNYTYKETDTSSNKISAVKNGIREVAVESPGDANYFEKNTAAGKLELENSAVGTMLEDSSDRAIEGFSTVELENTEVAGMIYVGNYSSSYAYKETVTTDTLLIDGKETITKKITDSGIDTEIETATGKITVKDGCTTENIYGYKTVVIGELASKKNPSPERNEVAYIYGSNFTYKENSSETIIMTDGVPVSVTLSETVTEQRSFSSKATIYNSYVGTIEGYQTVIMKNSETQNICCDAAEDTTEKCSAKTDKKGVVTATGQKTENSASNSTVTVTDSIIGGDIFGYKNVTLERVQLGSTMEINGEPIWKVVRKGVHTFDNAVDYDAINDWGWYGSTPANRFRTYTYTRTESQTSTGKLVMKDIEGETALSAIYYATVSITGSADAETPLRVELLSSGGNSKGSYKAEWEYLGINGSGQRLAKSVTTNEKETRSAAGTATLKDVEMNWMLKYKTVNLVNVTGTDDSGIAGGNVEIDKYVEIQNWVFRENEGWVQDGNAAYTDAKGNAIDRRPKTVYSATGSASLKDSSLSKIYGYQTVTLENSSVDEIYINPEADDPSDAEFKAVKSTVNIKGAGNRIGTYEGGSGNDTMTVAKNAVLDADGFNFGDGNDTLNISGILTTSASKAAFGSGNDTLNIAKGGALRLNVDAGIDLDDTFGGDGFGDQCKINGDLVLLGTRENILHYLSGPFAIKFSGSGAIATNTDTAFLLAADWNKVYDIGTQDVAKNFQSTAYESADNTMKKAAVLSDWLDADGKAENYGWLCGEGSDKFADTTDWFKFTLEDGALAGLDGVQKLFIEGLTEYDSILFYDSKGNERPFTTLDDNSWVTNGDGTGSGYQAVDFSRWADGDYLLEISLGETRKDSAALSYSISKDGVNLI